jgi:hypothetical protein
MPAKKVKGTSVSYSDKKTVFCLALASPSEASLKRFSNLYSTLEARMEMPDGLMKGPTATKSSPGKR